MIKKNIDIIYYHRRFAITNEEAEEMDFYKWAAYYKESRRQAMKLYNLKGTRKYKKAKK